MQVHTQVQSQSTKAHTARLLPSGSLRPFVLVTGLFFLWGMSNNLTDILVQQFRKSFELSSLEAQLVQTAVFLGYFAMAIPAAMLMERKGYKAGILAGLILFAAGTFAFWPAALLGRYGPFLAALFLVGCGSAILETASNPFIAQAGPTETANRRLNLSQAFNPPGTIVGVLLGTYFIFSGVELSPAQVTSMKASGTYAAYLHGEIMRVVPVYVGLACLVLLFALLIAVTKFPAAADTAAADAPETSGGPGIMRSSLWLAVVAQFFYCGAQVSTWSALIPYMRQYTMLPERATAFWLMGNLIAFSVGRIVATTLMRWVAPMKLIWLFSLANVAILAAAMARPGMTGGICLLITSFFMAPMYPTIFASGVEGLGAATKRGGSVLVMAVVGAALVPPALGYVARRYQSYAAGYAVTLACYVVIAVYSWISRRKGVAVTAADFAV